MLAVLSPQTKSHLTSTHIIRKAGNLLIHSIFMFSHSRRDSVKQSEGSSHDNQLYDNPLVSLNVTQLLFVEAVQSVDHSDADENKDRAGTV